MWLEDIIEDAEKYLREIPDGVLHVRHNHNTVQYYCKYPDEKERYIRKAEEELARQLAQKDYAIKLIEFATKKIIELKRNIAVYDRDEIVKFHEKFSEERQKLITPFILSSEESVKLWLEQGKQMVGGYGAYPLDVDKGILTEQGELVRSKSEKIIADKLYMMNIPYIYERVLQFDGNNYVYPDFTVFNRNTCKEVYWEHLGMMDIPKYANKAVKKISTYQKNGIYLGDKLIITQETSEHFLNTKELEGLIKKFLM